MRRWTTCVLILFVLMLSGCAARQSVIPPLAKIPSQRPAIVDDEGRLTTPGVGWLSAVVQAYLLNCTTLSVQRGEDPRQCREGLE